MSTLVILIVIGFGLLFAELILPGMIAGILGALCLVAAVIYGYLHYGAQTGTWILLGELLGALLFFILWARYFFQSPLGRHLVLDSGSSSTTPLGIAVGDSGEALTHLRPSGAARIKGCRCDVQTRGDYITAGTPVAVVKIDGPVIFVRPQPPTPETHP